MPKINSISFTYYKSYDSDIGTTAPAYIIGRQPRYINVDIEDLPQEFGIDNRYPLTALDFSLRVGTNILPMIAPIGEPDRVNFPYSGRITFRVDEDYDSFFNKSTNFSLSCTATNSANQSGTVDIGVIGAKATNKVHHYNPIEERFQYGLMRCYHHGEWICGRINNFQSDNTVSLIEQTTTSELENNTVAEVEE